MYPESYTHRVLFLLRSIIHDYMVKSNEFVYRKGGSYMDSLVNIIQNYAAIISLTYLIAIYSNDFGKCLKKNNPTVFCKTFLHNIAKKKYTPLRLKFFSDYFGLDRAFLSRKLSPVKLKMCA